MCNLTLETRALARLAVRKRSSAAVPVRAGAKRTANGFQTYSKRQNWLKSAALTHLTDIAISLVRRVGVRRLFLSRVEAGVRWEGPVAYCRLWIITRTRRV